MVKKIKKIQIFRHLIQLVLFFLLPGLYIMALSELKGIYQMVMKGNFDFVHILLNSVELISLTIITIVVGRFFCGWMCGFGAYNDLIHEISKNIFKVKYKVNKNVDNVLKFFKYIVLVSIIALSLNMGDTILTSASPWDAFAQITDLPQVISSLTLGLILLVLITLGAFFIERFFCRYLCPLGAFFNITSRLSIFKISMPKNKCGNCRACTSQCSMGIALYKKDEVQGGECINCLKCVEVCPRRNAKANILDINVDSKLASSAALAACIGVYSINGLGAGIFNESEAVLAANTNTNSSVEASNDVNNSAATDNSIAPNNAQQPAGTPSGAAGSNGTTVSNGEQTDNGTSKNNTQSNVQTPKQPAVNNNTPAPGNSNTGNNSNTASNSATANNNTKPNNNTTTNGNTSSGAASGSTSGNTTQNTKYKDGTYTGNGTGFRGGTTVVSVTISNGKITSIITLSEQDTPRFYQRAVNVVTEDIISEQSTSVDAVSGATYSSRGIMQAVANALSKAK